MTMQEIIEMEQMQEGIYENMDEYENNVRDDFDSEFNRTGCRQVNTRYSIDQCDPMED
jgi:hypothetical protein